MKRLSLALPLLVLSACVTMPLYSDFHTTPVPGVACSILYDGERPVVTHPAAGDTVYGLGETCPKNLSADMGGYRISKRSSIVVGEKGRYAILYSYPNNDTNIVDKSIIRRNDPGNKKFGNYRIFTQKLKPGNPLYR